MFKVFVIVALKRSVCLPVDGTTCRKGGESRHVVIRSPDRMGLVSNHLKYDLQLRFKGRLKKPVGLVQDNECRVLEGGSDIGVVVDQGLTGVMASLVRS